jgi:zinc-ribbon domain
MEVICEHCKTKLNIPDERIPKGQKVSATCPKCKERLTFDAREKMDDGRLSPGDSGKEPELAASTRPYVIEDDDEALVYYDEGVRLALVMGEDARRINPVRQALETLKFKCVLAENPRKGIGKMRLHHFDVVIFEEDFGGVSLDQSPVLHYLNHLSMPERRRMFVTILGRNFKTMDQMTAFAVSANLVVRVKDIGQLPGILKRAMSENEKFYKVFTETLRETGKA